MDLPPDTLLHNRYRIQHKLGVGGMGAVYLAFDTSLESEVAVKVNQNPTADSTTQFLHEARLLAALRHPNLPRVIDYFVLEQAQYLVMDYIPGDDLLRKVEKEGAQSLEQVLRWAEQLGGALDYLHSQNPPVIHRDIKPANIKITPEGQLLLVDFGISKSTDPSQMTAAGAVGYTPGYAPPEQYGTARTGPYSDQYALAATLYMLLTGQRPVDGIQRVMGTATLQPLRQTNPQIPEYVDAAIQQAMSVRPEDRFPGVKDFVTSLLDPSYQTTVLRSQAVVSAGAVQDQTVASATKVAAPAVRPARSGWLGVGIGVGALTLVGAVVVIALLAVLIIGPRRILSRLRAAPSSTPLVAAVLPTLTPPPPVSTDTPAPTVTLTLTSTLTEAPVPTDTPPPPSPSPTLEPQLVGGGGMVAFASNRGGDANTYQIWTMKVVLGDAGLPVGTGFTQITNNPGSKRQPAWSPDGKKILFTAQGIKPEYGLDIWVMNADGSGQVDLSQRKGNDTDPTWSPNGQWIAFTNAGREDGVLRIVLMDPAGINQIIMTRQTYEYQPAWSPDMKWLAFVLAASDHRYLNIHNMQGGLEAFLTPTPFAFDRSTIFGRLGEVSQPAWSPDGAWLAYTRLNGSQTFICTVGTEAQNRGGDVAPLTTTGADGQPAWSPDSKWIIFSSKRDGNLEIYIMSAGGTQQTNLSNQSKADDTDPAWH